MSGQVTCDGCRQVLKERPGEPGAIPIVLTVDKQRIAADACSQECIPTAVRSACQRAFGAELVPDATGAVGIAAVVEYSGDPKKHPGCERRMHRTVSQDPGSYGGPKLACAAVPQFWAPDDGYRGAGLTQCKECFAPAVVSRRALVEFTGDPARFPGCERIVHLHSGDGDAPMCGKPIAFADTNPQVPVHQQPGWRWCIACEAKAQNQTETAHA